MADRLPARQSKPPATTGGSRTPRTTPRTINVTYNVNQGGSQGGPQGGGWSPSGGTGTQGGAGGWQWVAWTRSTLGSPARNVKPPKPVPVFAGNREVIVYAWLIAMIVVGFDEWKNYGILPRPIRLWDTSIVYGLLVLVSVVDAMVPIANALAIGYTIVLIWQYFGGSGQFSHGAQREAAAGEGSGGQA